MTQVFAELRRNMKTTALQDYKPPALASYISFFGWFSFVVAFFAFINRLYEAVGGGVADFWMAWGVCAVWCLVGLLLLAAAAALRYLAFTAHHVGLLSFGGIPQPLNSGLSLPAKPAPLRSKVDQSLQFHVARDGKDLGPMPAQRIRQLLNSGQLKISDQFFDPHTNDWLGLDLLPA